MTQLSRMRSTQVGCRFSGNHTQMLRMGGKGTMSPPRMVCYRPQMKESDLVYNLERYITNESRRQALNAPRQTKHQTKQLRGSNDISKFTWSTIQPECSELPAQREA